MDHMAVKPLKGSSKLETRNDPNTLISGRVKPADPQPTTESGKPTVPAKPAHLSTNNNAKTVILNKVRIHLCHSYFLVTIF